MYPTATRTRAATQAGRTARTSRPQVAVDRPAATSFTARRSGRGWRARGWSGRPPRRWRTVGCPQLGPQLAGQPLALVVEPPVPARPEVPDRAGAGRGLDLGRDRRRIGGAVPVVVVAPVDQPRVGELRIGDGAQVGPEPAARRRTELVGADDHQVTRCGLLVHRVDEPGQLRSGLGRRPDAAEQPEGQQHRKADRDRGERPTGQARRHREDEQDQDPCGVPRGEGRAAHQAAQGPEPQRDQADTGERGRYRLRRPAQHQSPTAGLAATEHRQHDDGGEGRAEQLALEDAGAAVHIEVAPEPVQGHAEDRQRVAGAAPRCAGVGDLVDEDREPRQERQAPDRERDQQTTSRPAPARLPDGDEDQEGGRRRDEPQRPVVRQQEGGRPRPRGPPPRRSPPNGSAAGAPRRRGGPPGPSGARPGRTCALRWRSGRRRATAPAARAPTMRRRDRPAAGPPARPAAA